MFKKYQVVLLCHPSRLVVDLNASRCPTVSKMLILLVIPYSWKDEHDGYSIPQSIDSGAGHFGTAVSALTVSALGLLGADTSQHRPFRRHAVCDGDGTRTL